MKISGLKKNQKNGIFCLVMTLMSSSSFAYNFSCEDKVKMADDSIKIEVKTSNPKSNTHQITLDHSTITGPHIANYQIDLEVKPNGLLLFKNQDFYLSIMPNTPAQSEDQKVPGHFMGKDPANPNSPIIHRDLFCLPLN